ncbi:hypothetical protein [Vaginisenegalia massiliensis]|uniref:hypothetical protein n=1 Tax=Vaginisenegalia massiliensis TaxID=2058294 RepID=UPI000F5496ED|nr:hypothetical protein [Vaginisenegalia massiliensis]
MKKFTYIFLFLIFWLFQNMTVYANSLSPTDFYGLYSLQSSQIQYIEMTEKELLIYGDQFITEKNPTKDPYSHLVNFISDNINNEHQVGMVDPTEIDPDNKIQYEFLDNTNQQIPSKKVFIIKNYQREWKENRYFEIIINHETAFKLEQTGKGKLKDQRNQTTLTEYK